MGPEWAYLKTSPGSVAIPTLLQYSPDGKKVLSVSNDGALRSWDMESNKLKILIDSSKDIDAFSFSPDGKKILTGSNNSTVSLWDQDGNLLQEFKANLGSYLFNCIFT